MQERTEYDPRDNDHGVTITTARLGRTPVHHATCLCGWRSELLTSRRDVVAASNHHTAEVCCGPAGMQPVEPVRVDQVARAVADRMCQRGVVLDADEMATVAMALDCSPADLLPSHPTTDEPEPAKYADNGLTWDHEAHTVTVRRLPWMNDKQWVKVRDAMIKYFDEMGLIPNEVTR